MTAGLDMGRERAFPWRILGWSVPAVILLLPLVGGAPWTPSDYVLMAVLLGGGGLLVEGAVRVSVSGPYRIGAALAVLAAFGLVVVNGAVGILGSEGNPANAMFLGVIAIALIGAALARLRAAGMARAMLAAAVAQVAVAVVAVVGALSSPGAAGVYEASVATGLFGGLWLASAALFRMAAR